MTPFIRILEALAQSVETVVDLPQFARLHGALDHQTSASPAMDRQFRAHARSSLKGRSKLEWDRRRQRGHSGDRSAAGGRDRERR